MTFYHGFAYMIEYFGLVVLLITCTQEFIMIFGFFKLVYCRRPVLTLSLSLLYRPGASGALKDGELRIKED